MFFAFSYSETLNIINKNATAVIFLNGINVGQGTATNLDVRPGTHHVEIVLNNETIYSDDVVVQAGETKSLNTTTFVGVTTEYADRGAKIIETNRIRKSLGSFGIGGYGGPVTSGLSGKWFMNESYGVQCIGWLSTNKDTSFSSYELRGFYVLGKNLINNNFQTLYLILGAGKSNYTASGKDEIKELLEISLGIENNFGKSEGSMFTVFNDAFYTIEIGLNKILTNHAFDYQGIKAGISINWYFI